MKVIRYTVRARKDNIGSKQPTWAVFRRMILGCTTCTEIFGNGVAISGMVIMMARQSMAAFGKPEIADIVSCAAVRGTTIQGTAVLPIAAGAGRRITTTLSGFGLSAFFPRLFSPLPFCSLRFFSFARSSTQ